MKDDEKYLDRDLSWLSFNERVLMEAADPSVPLYERIKFLAIFSSNLDEFYRVRVAALRSIVRINKKKINKRFIKKPKKLLRKINKEVTRQQEKFGEIKRHMILPELKKNRIILYRNERVIEEHKKFVECYFKGKVLSYLQPVIMTREKNKAPYLENRMLYFAVVLKHKVNGGTEYVHLNIPASDLPRFIPLPKIRGYYYLITLEDIIRENLNFLFPNHLIAGAYTIKLNRDADLNIEDEYAGDLVKKIKKQLRKRNLGVPSRFLYDKSMPGHLLDFLAEQFNLQKDDLTAGGHYHNMHDLLDLENPLKPRLESEILIPVRKPSLDINAMFFTVLDKQDIMLHFPYQCYGYVLRYFKEAAVDEQVEEIKITLYRIAHNSFICNALISAANNGKKITVFVEIKARFDEENNLKWAERMERAGITIIYSMPGIKVHAKIALISRRLSNGRCKRYGFFGTGNFNEKTASVYADEALLTCHAGMTEELDRVFNYLYKKEPVESFEHLLVSQFNMSDRFSAMIKREIEHARQGRKAFIVLKLNNLQDHSMIDQIYEASQAGVKVELIVRAICCLKPGVKGLSEHIKVRRIVDRYLEHSRVYYFYNNGNDDLYQGSADWMRRNLYGRVEVAFPVYERSLKEEILKLLEVQLADNVKAVLIDKHLKNIPIRNNQPKLRAQAGFYKWLKNREGHSNIKNLIAYLSDGSAPSGG